MVSVAEAQGIVFSHPLVPRVVVLSIAEAVGRILAEDVRADRDFPPFDRVAMDGIAIAFQQFNRGQRKFFLEQVQAAGEPQKTLLNSDHAIEVMTGAMLPKGTDTVIRYEDLSISEQTASIALSDVVAGANIHRQRQDASRNDILIEKNMIISPAEIALLASVGKSTVKVFDFPVAAIISTGDELVDVDQTPEPHQIRRSNVFAIGSAMRQMNWQATQHHLPDREDHLREALTKIASENDVLILSGGVSKGKFDFIPQVLESIGIKKRFHQVSQRPGKPFWFGVSQQGKVAFALPGNPVSTYMCFYKYIKPWALKSVGLPLNETHAILAEDFSFQPKLTHFLQVEVKNEGGMLNAYPRAGGGSGDFANLKNVSFQKGR